MPFLAAWIVGWPVGELVALALLGALLAGMVDAAFGIGLPFASRIAPDGSAPFFLLFVLFWLTLWTLGAHALPALAGR